ncbi:MAG: sporulation integral membrane protein YlbJ [Tissierellia bacterium]|nr:sporulation integral membrane protein YlbJ [Tissierellia bacterium]
MKKTFPNILFAVCILCILIAIIKHPDQSLESASNGLYIWFNIIIPSLLPFFIISEILIGIGFVGFIGRLSEPLIKFLFNIPGSGAYAFSISAVSGYPMGAKVVSDLRRNNIISKAGADKMICFSSTSGPLFMIGTIATGMLKNTSLIPLIIYPHYLGALTLGLLMRPYKKSDAESNFENNPVDEEPNRSIGSLLTDSIQNSFGTITLIGGFIIFYSVLVRLLFIYIPFNAIIDILHSINLPSISIDVCQGLISGLFEITTGCNIISRTNISILSKIMIINFLIGWSGFSIHSQALSFITRTDINAKLYILTKFLHGLLATLYSYILYRFRYNVIIKTSFSQDTLLNGSILSLYWSDILIRSSKIVIFTIFYILIGSLIISLLYRLFKKSTY